MSRPPLFYLVAAWSCLALLVQASYLARPAKAYQVAGEPIPVLWILIPLVALGFVIWQTVGLVQLRRSNRWLAVVVFCCWSAMLVWKLTIGLRQSSGKPPVLVVILA